MKTIGRAVVLAMAVGSVVCLSELTPVMAQPPVAEVMPPVRHVEPVTDELRLQFSGYLGFSIHEPLSESALIQILQDKTNMKRDVAAPLLTTLPKTPEIVQALRDGLAEARLDDSDPASREAMIVWALAIIGETDWEDGVVAELPTMTYDRIAQLGIANILVSVGRAEGWPIVKAAITDAEPPFLVQSGLYHVEYFDQLPNPDGGKPIDILTELRQLFRTAPAQVRLQIVVKAERIASQQLLNRYER